MKTSSRDKRFKSLVYEILGDALIASAGFTVLWTLSPGRYWTWLAPALFFITATGFGVFRYNKRNRNLP